MANPSTLVSFPQDEPFAIIEATNTEGSVTLEWTRWYRLVHNGVNTSGTADTATIFLSDAATVVTTFAAGSGHAALMDGQETVVGPGLNTLYFKTASGSPTFTIYQGSRLHGSGA